MNYKLYRALTIVFLTLNYCLIINPVSISAQEKAKETTFIWDSLLTKLKSGKLSDTAYLKKIDSFVNSSPLILGDKDLKTKLNTYKKIAWGYVKLHRYRISYYDYLSDNAYINNLAGVCIYYAEKKEEELKKVKPYINSLTLLRRQYSIYNRIRGGNKFSGTKSYYENLPFFEWLPEGIQKDSVPVATVRNAFLVMLAQANIFAFQADSINATKVRQLADKIFEVVKFKFSKDKDLIERITAYYYIINEFEMRSRLNYAAAALYDIKAKEITNSLLNGKKQSWKIGFKDNILIHLTDIYLDYKKIDSAAKYLDSLSEFETKFMPGIRDRSEVLEFTGRLMALKSDYKAAYVAKSESSKITDSVFAERTVDINNNMYAQAQAEDTREELEKTQSQKRKLYLSIAGIVLLLIFSVSALSYRIKNKEKEIKQRIHHLNTASDIQIEELKEQNRIAKLEEQKRLGMELHDDLAGHVAFLRTKVESEILLAIDPESKKRLNEISLQIAELYNKTRTKSHTWYNNAVTESEQSFKKRVQSLMDNGLPDKNFEKEIIVEENAMKNISTRTKIEILYVIQEAITNILKHAKATKVSILIYRDIPGLMLQIIDDGVGFDTNKKKSGIGLASISTRIEGLKGTLEIQSDPQKGTSIDISIPVETETLQNQ